VSLRRVFFNAEAHDEREPIRWMTPEEGEYEFRGRDHPAPLYRDGEGEKRGKEEIHFVTSVINARF